MVVKARKRKSESEKPHLLSCGSLKDKWICENQRTRYQCLFMYEQSKISEEAFSTLKESIKEEMPEWLANRYDDPEIENMEEVWGL